MIMLVLQDLTKIYRTRAGEVKALDGVSLQIDQGEFVAVCGPSGSGKTTLLMMIAAMLRPSRGTVRFDDHDIYQMPGPARARFRAQNIGFVFQMFHLVPYLNVMENVLLASAMVQRNDGRARAGELLQQLGLGPRVGHRPAELSAGEKQRTAIARALLNEPRLILADEPTGNLDAQNARSVLEHLQGFQRSGGTVIMATHGPAAQEFATWTLHLREGHLVKEAM
jgi:ABC-type lipoprotein export system ATPase subunit